LNGYSALINTSKREQQPKNAMRVGIRWKQIKLNGQYKNRPNSWRNIRYLNKNQPQQHFTSHNISTFDNNIERKSDLTSSLHIQNHIQIFHHYHQHVLKNYMSILFPK
jgi:hypothetical protein